MTRYPSFLSLAAVAAVVLPLGALAADPVPQNDLLNATLWVSNSVEFKANTLSMFQLAKMRLDEALADKSWSATGQTDAADKPVAIIADADETLIRQRRLRGLADQGRQDYSSKTYDAWTKAMAAKAVPGAVDFLKYADSKGSRFSTSPIATRRRKRRHARIWKPSASRWAAMSIRFS